MAGREGRESLHEGRGVCFSVDERNSVSKHLFPGLHTGANVEVDAVA